MPVPTWIITHRYPLHLCEHVRRLSLPGGHRRRGKLVGFALLRPHSPLPVFSQTAEITCFIAPEHTGKGMEKQCKSGSCMRPKRGVSDLTDESTGKWPSVRASLDFSAVVNPRRRGKKKQLLPGDVPPLRPPAGGFRSPGLGGEGEVRPG